MIIPCDAEPMGGPAGLRGGGGMGGTLDELLGRGKVSGGRRRFSSWGIRRLYLTPH